MGLALALGTRAPVLLLDEPLASLDPLARREFLQVLVDAVRAAGSTALSLSHVGGTVVLMLAGTAVIVQRRRPG